MRVRDFGICVKAGMLCPSLGHAHVSEQGFVLLLPTGVYTIAGVAAVALTVLALVAVPAQWLRRAFLPHRFAGRRFETSQTICSLISFALLLALVWLGLNGPRDPLSNLMPLVFWTLGWVALVSLAGVFGNLWHWLNPWAGLHRLIGAPQVFALRPGLGVWPACALLLTFAGFLLADIAPDDPARLARIAGLYWLVTMAGVCIFGPGWLRQAELGHVIFRAYAMLAPVRLRSPGGFGTPGWQVLALPHSAGMGTFALLLLGAGSFDGINETFWWLGRIGVNPLEFPGRSAVAAPTLLGLAGAAAGLIAVFAITVWLGLRFARLNAPFADVFGPLALTLLPIALVYHVAHYLTSFMVSIQYTIAALSDPLARGSDWLGLGTFRVTTGFFNDLDSVRLIWLTQAGLVVGGHVWSVLLSHRIALDLSPDSRGAVRLTLPLSLFMIAYTCLGLWLLAAPKGA